MALGVLLAAPTAHAATRYADPNGVTTGNCTSPDPAHPTDPPCTLERAVEDAAVQDGDEIVVLPGSYDLIAGTLTIDDRLNVQKGAGAVPSITSSSNSATVLASANAAADSTISDLSIANTGSGNALVLSAPNAIAQRLVMRNVSSAQACNTWNVTIRDSVCHNEGSGPGVGYFIGTNQPIDLRLRNVTAISEGTGLFGHAVSIGGIGGGTFTASAKNVIAFGDESDATAAQGGAGTTATLTFESSNYDEVNPSATGTVTPPGAGTNQTALPVFANAAGNDFHQAPGSPTIDAGAAVDLLGDLDFEGEPRIQGPAVDIGADETSNPQPEPDPPASDTAPPDTQIAAGPEGKTRKKSATFSFSGTDARAVASFQCKLDSGSFETCTSPKAYSKLKKGRHTFSVRAIDVAGNVDPTPATRSWKVKRKRKRK